MFVFILLICFTVSSCTVYEKDFNDIEDVRITDVGYEGDSAQNLCSGFRLTTDQVIEYFKLAQPISREKAHHDIDYYSCWVNGEFKQYGRLCQWHIDVGGLANVYCNGSEYKMYCDSCDDVIAVGIGEVNEKGSDPL